MKTETPALGVMKTKTYPDSEWYSIACDCGNHDHTIEMEIEFDKQVNSVVVHTYTTQHVDFWSESISAFSTAEKSPDCLFGFVYWGVGLYNSIRRKISLTWTLWTKGSIKYSADTYMPKQAAINYANVIIDGVARMEKRG